MQPDLGLTRGDPAALVRAGSRNQALGKKDVPELTDDERASAPPFDPRPDPRRALELTGLGKPSAQLSDPPVRPSGSPALSVDRGQVYGALDLGTNNCRLLLARPSRRGFRVVDAFSRIIRLGEGVSQTGRLSDAAMKRTLDALRVCASKLARNDVERARCVATEACRIASNGRDFLRRVEREVGLKIEVLDRETEANLAVSGCASLIDYRADYVLVFDIGGGSSELIWLDLTHAERGGNGSGNGNGGEPRRRSGFRPQIKAWTSLPVGVVTLAERFGGHHVTSQNFEDMVAYVAGLIRPFEALHGFRALADGRNIHLLGTSGTVTTVAGIHLGLKRYDRARVDGCWLQIGEIQTVTYRLLARSYEERVAEPCIGHERADLVLAGCAILEAILRTWPSERLRVADRGLREGILATLMCEDGVYRAGRRRRRQRSG
jgi:exopolyphosphatase/guanosine-5'-triphosphate,3'-diphosphate pyrophosphatase